MIIKCFCKLIISAYRTDFSLVKAATLSWNQWSYDNLLQLKVWPIGFWNLSWIGGRKHKFTSKKDWERQWTILTFTFQVTHQRAQPRIRQWGRTCALHLLHLHRLHHQPQLSIKLQRHLYLSGNPQSERWKSGHGNTRKRKRGHGGRKSTTSMRHTCALMEKTMKLWPAPFSLMDWGQRRDRPRTWLRDWPGLCFLQPYCQPRLGAELQGREEGLANSVDTAQTSAWNKNILS